MIVQAVIEIDIGIITDRKGRPQGLTDDREVEVAIEAVDHHGLKDLDLATGVGIEIGMLIEGVGTKGNTFKN